MTRSQECDRRAARHRLDQAEAFVFAADLALDDDSYDSNPGVAASLSVLAGIAASDAACCVRLGRRARGRSHDEAVPLVASVVPHGKQMSKDLARLLARKDDAHYGIALVSRTDATKMISWARRMTVSARAVLES